MALEHELSHVTTTWKDILMPYWDAHKLMIESGIAHEQEQGHNVLPSKEMIFNAFKHFNVEDLKVVIIGQDCYYSRARNGQVLANGLCFSVSEECQVCPPSLKTIFKELQHEYGGELRQRTDLNDWAAQGALLLNCALTVREGKAGSHMKLWKGFTESVIKHIATTNEGIVYILWGEWAKAYAKYVDRNKNLVLECRHPSGLAASKGPFVGNNHFKMTNDYLVSLGKQGIIWCNNT
jgi:uracil-DNA glycosylase